MTKFLAGLTAIFFLAVTGVAHAQPSPPEPGVARVSLIRGAVSMQRGDSGDWVAVTLNTPLLTGDTISTGPDSRVEVQLDFGNVLRLDSNSTAKIANLDRDNVQVQVAQGLVSYDVLIQDSAQAEVDTPNVAVHPQGNGSYRIEVPTNNQSVVTVVKGQADVSTPQGSTRVEQGDLITIEGIDNPQYRITQAPQQDAWDQWNIDRDGIIRNAQSWRYTDRYYTGSHDLDAYGHWIYVPNYGNVWRPVVAAGWAPYRSGRWVWEPFYGWTWVSYEPWGWAPYHYGRWFLYAGSWCWWPGPVSYYRTYYPVWAPAYVSFFGFGYRSAGFSFSIGFGFGNVGWLPIGPADPFYPWYGAGRRFNVINVTNINYIRNNYGLHGGFAPLYRGRGGYSNLGRLVENGRIHRGVSWMPDKDFGHAPVPRQQGRIDGAAFREARLFTGRVPVLPTRESLRSTSRAPNPDTMRRGIGRNQHFFSNSRPAPAQLSFNQQRAQLERVMQNYRNQPGVKPGEQRAFTSAPRGAARISSGQPGTRSNTNKPAPNFTQDSNGWQRFGNSGQPQRPVQAQRSPVQRNVPPAAQRGGATGSSSAWKTFSQPNRSTSGNGARSQQGRPAANSGQTNNRAATPAPAQRGGNQRIFTPAGQSQPTQRRSAPAQAPASRPGWKIFTPQSGQPRNAPPARGLQRAPAQRQGGSRVSTPPSRPSSQANSGRQDQSSRQPLNLRQPIVQRRVPSPPSNVSRGSSSGATSRSRGNVRSSGSSRSSGNVRSSGSSRSSGSVRSSGSPRSSSRPSSSSAPKGRSGSASRSSSSQGHRR